MRKQQLTVNQDNVRELFLYTVNNEMAVRQAECFIKNYRRKVEKGTYDSDKAVKGFIHVVQTGMKEYAREFGVSHWYTLANTAERLECAKQLLDYYTEDIQEEEE